MLALRCCRQTCAGVLTRRRRSRCSGALHAMESGLSQSASASAQRPDHDILAVPGVGRRCRIDAGRMERRPLDRTVRKRVIALQHRHLVGLLLREPVPLMVRPIGKARRLAHTVVINPIIGSVMRTGAAPAVRMARCVQLEMASRLRVWLQARPSNECLTSVCPGRDRKRASCL